MLAKLKPWISVLLGTAILALYLTGKAEGPLLLGLVAVLEGSLLLWALWGVYRTTRRFKQASGDPWKALEQGLSELVPPAAARFMVMEFRLWGCLNAWIGRRPPAKNEFPYHGNSMLGMIMGLLIFTTPVEIAVLEILIPWPWLKIATLVIALYGVLWFVMLFASIRSLPHRVEPYGLCLHYGVLASGIIPYTAIESVDVALRKAPRSGDGLQIDGDSAYFAINGETNLVVRLKEPLQLERAFGSPPLVREIYFRTDEPKRMIETLKGALIPA